jgi:hypothetical protein
MTDQLLSPEAMDLLAEAFPEVPQENLVRIVSYSQTLLEMVNDYTATNGTFAIAPGQASSYVPAVKKRCSSYFYRNRFTTNVRERAVFPASLDNHLR